MAARFWVGGTGTWDAATTTNWASSSGGAGGQSVPGASDDVTFDSSSGGGTVTVDFGGLITINSLTMTTFTGTLDFATNNNSLTMAGSFGASGAATRTLNLGSGTFTITGNTSNWDTSGSGLTLDAGTSTIAMAATGGTTDRRFFAGGKTYSTITVAGATSALSFTNAGFTAATLTIAADVTILFHGGATFTITTLTGITGTPSAPVMFRNSGVLGGRAIISSANNFTGSWMGLSQMQFQGGGTFTANDSFDFENNTGITINAPSVGGAAVAGVIG